MEQKNRTGLRVGIFIVVGLLLLLALSLKVDDTMFRKVRGVEFEAEFTEVKGLEIGSAIMLAGLEVGHVSKMEFDPFKGRVTATLFIQSPYKLKEESVASIRLQSLLGRYYVGIDYGDPSAAELPPGASVKTVESVDIDTALKIVAETGTEVKKLAQGFNENQGRMADQITALVEENREDIRKATESFASAGPKLDSALTSINEIFGDLKAGEGTAGKFLTDDTLYFRLSSAADGLTSLTADIRSGDGTLSKLLYSDDMSAVIEDAFKKIRDAADNMDSILVDNRQKIDSFFGSMETTGPRIEAAMEDISQITRKVNEGDGTLAKIINDPALYNDVQSAVNQLKAAFQEAEEQSVIRTVLSIMFGPTM